MIDRGHITAKTKRVDAYQSMFGQEARTELDVPPYDAKKPVPKSKCNPASKSKTKRLV